MVRWAPTGLISSHQERQDGPAVRETIPPLLDLQEGEGVTQTCRCVIKWVGKRERQQDWWRAGLGGMCVCACVQTDKTHQQSTWPNLCTGRPDVPQPRVPNTVKGRAKCTRWFVTLTAMLIGQIRCYNKVSSCLEHRSQLKGFGTSSLERRLSSVAG